MEHLYQVALGLIDHYGYGGLFVALVLANVGVPIGAELIVPVAGGLAATGHLSAVWLTIVVAVLGELAGGTLGYLIGRFGGRPLIDRYGRYLHLSHANLDRVQAFFEKYGSFSIFICRFVPVIRGIISIPAGLAEMNLLHFYAWYAIGSTIFCGGLVLLGAELGGHLDSVLPLLHRAGLLTLAAAVVIIVAAIVFALRRRKREVATP